MKKNLSGLKRYVRDIFKVGRLKIIVAFLLMLSVAGLNLFQPQIILKIIDEALPEKKTNVLIKLVGIYIIISLMICIFNYVLRYIY
ncbi:MAG: hypothetical protein UCV58_07790, partial [Clostridium saudiense]|nr:hypothetical protein [Clostridium saudiense]